MSTWDDKPNDYEHALQIIERLSAAHRQLQATIDCLGAEIERLRTALDDVIITDGDPRAVATKALGWVRVDQQSMKTEK